MCSPMPDDGDLGVAGPPACSRYPDCEAFARCGWPAHCDDEQRHPHDDFSDAIKGLVRAFAGPEENGR